MIGETLGFLAAALLLISAIAVPLSRVALGEDVEGAAVRFAIGARELKLFLALLRFSAIAVAALMILFVGLVALVEAGLVDAIARVLPGSRHFPSEHSELWLGFPVPIILVAVDATLAVMVVAVLVARFGILLVPVAAGESNASLSRAAALSRGNTWRLLIVGAALSIPVVILMAAAEFLVLGPAVRTNLLHALSAGMPDRALEILASRSLAIGAVASMAIVSFLALVAGASAVSYADRRDDVPLGRARANRGRTNDKRDLPTPFIDSGHAPAFAKVHPLATLLPSEMPVIEVQPPSSAHLSVEDLGDATASAERQAAQPELVAADHHALLARETPSADPVSSGAISDGDSIPHGETEINSVLPGEASQHEAVSADPNAAGAHPQV
jgi:hypothetical protein